MRSLYLFDTYFFNYNKGKKNTYLSKDYTFQRWYHINYNYVIKMYWRKGK